MKNWTNIVWSWAFKFSEPHRGDLELILCQVLTPLFSQKTTGIAFSFSRCLIVGRFPGLAVSVDNELLPCWGFHSVVLYFQFYFDASTQGFSLYPCSLLRDFSVRHYSSPQRIVGTGLYDSASSLTPITILPLKTVFSNYLLLFRIWSSKWLKLGHLPKQFPWKLNVAEVQDTY